MELFRLAALRELARLRSLDQPIQFLVQALDHAAHVVDRLLHLFVVALVGGGNQLVDLARGNLRQNPVSLANRQQNRVEHGVDAAHNVGVGALELLRLAAIRQLAFLRCIRQPHQFLLQALEHSADVVDRLLHLFVIALVGMRDQLVDLARGNLCQNPVSLADGQQNRVEHLVDALDHGAIHARELARPAALRQTPLFRGLHQPQNLLRYQHRLVGRVVLHAVRAHQASVSIDLVAVAFPVFADSCRWHISFALSLGADLRADPGYDL